MINGTLANFKVTEENGAGFATLCQRCVRKDKRAPRLFVDRGIDVDSKIEDSTDARDVCDVCGCYADRDDA